MSISLCMIVRDEARWLKESIESAKPFVDEIIVVDTGSEDDSVAIAQESGATVLESPWQHDFAGAKNLALEKATKDWILVLDADERLLPDDFKRLKDLTEKPTADAYKLELRNYVKTPSPGCVACPPSEITLQSTAYKPIKLARLFRNNKAYRYQYRVHEMIEPAIEAAKGKIAEAAIPVHHYGILTAEKLPHKMRYYAWLVFKELADHPDNARALFLAGQFCEERKQHDRALAYFQQAAAKDPKYKNVWFTIGNLLVNLRRTDEAMHAYEQSVVNNPESPNAPQALNNLTVLYANAGRREDAKKLVSAALKRFPDNAALKKNAEQLR